MADDSEDKKKPQVYQSTGGSFTGHGSTTEGRDDLGRVASRGSLTEGRQDASYKKKEDSDEKKEDSGTSSSGSGGGGAGASTTEGKTSGDDSLPVFDKKRVYLVKGSSLNALVNSIHTNRPRVVQNGGLRIDSTSDQGTFLAADLKTLDLIVCIDGVATTKTFYVAA